MTNERSLTLATYAAAFAAAAVVGAVIASISWQVSLAVFVASAAVFALAFLRIAVRPTQAQGVPDDGGSSNDDPRFRLARLAYYLGAASIGLLTVRPALGFTLSDWIFLSSLGLVVLVLLVYRISPPLLVPRPIAAGVVAFAVGGLLASRYAVQPYESGLIVVRMLYLTLAWFWLGTMVLRTRAQVQTAIGAWVFSVALSSSGAVAQFFYGDVIPGGTIQWGRMSGFTDHFNQMGGLAATAFVPALMLAVDSPQQRMRMLGTASTALITAGLLLSGSVGGLLAASTGTIVWFALRGMSLRIVVSFAVVVASAFLLMSTTGTTESPSPVQRLKTVTSAEKASEGTGGTLYTRLEGWEKAWDRIQEQPLIGVGLDSSTTVEALGSQAVHNMILSLWLTAGILGLVGIVMVIGGVLASGMRVLRNASASERSFVAALLAALVAFAEFSMSEPILFVRYGWFPSALLIALLAQQIRAGARSRQTESSRPTAAHSLATLR